MRLRGDDRPSAPGVPDVSGHVLGTVGVEPVRQVESLALETEDLLDLVPDRQHQEERQPHEDCEREDEAQPCL